MRNKIENGINLLGFARFEHGLGEALRLTAFALSYSGIEWSVYDFELNNRCSSQTIV